MSNIFDSFLSLFRSTEPVDDPLREFVDLPVWKRMAAGLASEDMTTVTSHLRHILPEMEKYVDTFPTYTLHNRTHIRNVVKIMGELLGARVGLLQGLEAMILILSAFYHDYGMIYSREEFGQIAYYDDFRNEFLDQTDARLAFEEAQRTLTEELAVWYCRWAHAKRVWKKMEQLEAQLGPLTYKKMPVRLAVGNVCESHNEPAEEIRTNESRFDKNFLGQGDLRFCALLLRLADILDFDNSRTPRSVYEFLDLANPRNHSEEISQSEWLKHMVSNGFTFPTEPSVAPLPFSATPTHPLVEQNIRAFLDVIDLELAASAGVTSVCADRWRGFPFPQRVDAKHIYSDNYRSGKFRFTLADDKILDLLTGDNLYIDDFVFIRELLQNAIDTVRHRTFVERIGGRSFEPADIQVSYFKDPEGYYWLRVDDQGMGMDRHIIENYLLKKGNSYYKSNQFKLEKINIKAAEHQDFVPISRFGIGLLSCFTSCDKIEISTCYFYRENHEPSEKTRLSIEGRGGYWVIRSEKEHHVATRMPGETGWEHGYRDEPGTSIACRLKTAREFRGLNMEEQVDRFLLAPEIPVVFHGKRLGGDRTKLVMTPWCRHVRELLPDVYVQRVREALNIDVQRIEIEVRPVDLASEAATPNLAGQLVLVVPRITILNASQHIRLNDHVQFREELGKTYLICYRTEKSSNGQDARIEVPFDITQIITNISVPTGFLNKHDSPTLFRYPKVSHNGIVVYDNEHQLAVELPPFDHFLQSYHQGSRFVLMTGIFSFRDSLLPDLEVSRSKIKQFTVEIIAHVLYATRALNDYTNGQSPPFSYFPILERSPFPSKLMFSIDNLEQTGLYGPTRNYWHQFPCLAERNEGLISIDRAMELAQDGPIDFNIRYFPTEFSTYFFRYIIQRHFIVKYVIHPDGNYLEGRRAATPIVLPDNIRSFEPMRFLECDDGSRIWLDEKSLNANSPLVQWLIQNSRLLYDEYNYYTHQLLNILSGTDSPADKIQAANDILIRLRIVMPEEKRPNKTLELSPELVFGKPDYGPNGFNA